MVPDPITSRNALPWHVSLERGLQRYRSCFSRSSRSCSATVIAPVMVSPVNRASSPASRQVSSFLMLRLIVRRRVDDDMLRLPYAAPQPHSKPKDNLVGNSRVNAGAAPAPFSRLRSRLGFPPPMPSGRTQLRISPCTGAADTTRTEAKRYVRSAPSWTPLPPMHAQWRHYCSDSYGAAIPDNCHASHWATMPRYWEGICLVYLADLRS